MSTGYTCQVADGEITDFKQFLLQCSRAFGACIQQRDDPHSDLPKRMEVSNYHKDELKKAKLDLKNYRKSLIYQRVNLLPMIYGSLYQV